MNKWFNSDALVFALDLFMNSRFPVWFYERVCVCVCVSLHKKCNFAETLAPVGYHNMNIMAVWEHSSVHDGMQSIEYSGACNLVFLLLKKYSCMMENCYNHRICMKNCHSNETTRLWVMNQRIYITLHFTCPYHILLHSIRVQSYRKSAMCWQHRWAICGNWQRNTHSSSCSCLC